MVAEKSVERDTTPASEYLLAWFAKLFISMRSYINLGRLAPIDVMAVAFIVWVSNIAIHGDARQILTAFWRIFDASDVVMETPDPTLIQLWLLALIGTTTATLIYSFRSILELRESWFPVAGALLVVASSLDFPLRSFLADVNGTRAELPLILADAGFLISLFLLSLLLVFVMGRSNTLKPFRLFFAGLVALLSLFLTPSIVPYVLAVIGFSSLFELLRFRKARATVVVGLVFATAGLIGHFILRVSASEEFDRSGFEVSQYHLLVNLALPAFASVLAALLVRGDLYELLWRFRHVWTLYIAELFVILMGTIFEFLDLEVGPEFLLVHIYYWMPFLALMGRTLSFASEEKSLGHHRGALVFRVGTLLSILLEKAVAPVLTTLLFVYFSAGIL